MELRLINPHTLILLDVEDEDGEIVRWQIETGSPSQLARRGWNRDTLKPGDKITVTALAAKSGARVLNEATIVMTESGEEILTRRQ